MKLTKQYLLWCRLIYFKKTVTYLLPSQTNTPQQSDNVTITYKDIYIWKNETFVTIVRNYCTLLL